MSFIKVDTPPKKRLSQIPDTLWGFIWFFVSQVWWVVCLVFTFYAIAAACQAVVPFLLKDIVDTLSQNAELSGAQTDAFKTSLILLVLVGYVLHRVFWSLANYLNGPKLRHYFKGMIHMQLFSYIVRHNIGFFENDFAGRITSKAENTGLALVDALDLMSYVIVMSLVTLLVVTVLMSQLNAEILVVFLVWFVSYGVVAAYFVRKISVLSAEMADGISNFSGALVDTVSNVSAVILSAQEKAEQKRLAVYANKSAQKSTDFATFWFQYRLAMGTLNALLAAGLGWFLFAGYQSGSFSNGDVVMALTSLGLATSAIWDIAIYAGDITRKLGIIKDGMDTLVRKQTTANKHTGKGVFLGKKISGIDFKNVSFAYSEDAHVFKNLNLHIPPKAKIGIVGQSGAGKTTLIKLLLGLYSPQQGQVCVDKKPLESLDPESLRQNISLVSQDPVLFHRSIEENIRYGKPDATKEEIIAAAKKAKAHQFIASVRDEKGRTGYAAHVGERGVKLSGGQKQRIALARVFLEDAPVLVLDEATSALDSALEVEVQSALTRLMANKTVIAIAHRLSTLQMLDTIYVLADGKIAEQGTHKSLLKQKGTYAHLWKLQQAGFVRC